MTEFDKTPTPNPTYDSSKVPTEIGKIANYVRTKYKGEDILEAIAQSSEIAGVYANEARQLSEYTQVRQDTAEDLNNQLLQEMTDKDIISAPEIIKTRKGYVDLESRLDDELPINPKWFGAKGDGVTDDGQALRSAHEFANSIGRKVLYPVGTYYLHEVSNIPIMTDVDASKAEIVINPSFEPTNSMFDIVPTESSYEIHPDLSTLVVNKDTVSIPQITGHGDAILELINDNKRVYIRYGANANTGIPQSDTVVIDTHGNLKNDIVWDFDEITRAFIYPIDKTVIDVVFGRITYMNNVDRTSYAFKNINVTRSRVNLTVMDEGLVPLAKKSPYAGVIQTGKCAYVTIKDSNLENKPTVQNAQGVAVGTYGMLLQGTISLTLMNVHSKEIPEEFDGWGIMGGNVLKDFKVIDCDLSRIDSHQGTHNMTIRNTKVGSKGITVTGTGLLELDNVTITGPRSAVNLRNDYGSTWNGPMKFKDITHKPDSSHNAPYLVYGTPTYTHDFGYDCHFGTSIEIDGYTVHDREEDYLLSILSINSPNTSNKVSNYYFPDFVSVKRARTQSGRKILTVFDVGNYHMLSAIKDGSWKEESGVNSISPNVRLEVFDGTWTDREDVVGLMSNDYQLYSSGNTGFKPDTLYLDVYFSDLTDLSVNILAFPFKINVNNCTVRRIYANNGGGGRAVINVNKSDIDTNNSAGVYHVRVPALSSVFSEVNVYPPRDTSGVIITDGEKIKQAHQFLGFGGLSVQTMIIDAYVYNSRLMPNYPIESLSLDYVDYGFADKMIPNARYNLRRRGATSLRPRDLSARPIPDGYEYFDTTLGYPVYRHNGNWRNSSGAAV